MLPTCQVCISRLEIYLSSVLHLSFSHVLGVYHSTVTKIPHTQIFCGDFCVSRLKISPLKMLFSSSEIIPLFFLLHLSFFEYIYYTFKSVFNHTNVHSSWIRDWRLKVNCHRRVLLDERSQDFSLKPRCCGKVSQVCPAAAPGLECIGVY